jgi:hypothetical protein
MDAGHGTIGASPAERNSRMTRTVASLLSCAIVTYAVLTAQTPQAGLEGTWRGTLVTPGGSLRLVLQVSKAPDGLLTGQLDSLDQGSRIPIDRITVTGDAVRLELKAVGGTYEGALNAARTELKGQWTQGTPLPLTFMRDPAGAPAPPAAATPPAGFPLGLPLELVVPVPPTPFIGGDGGRYLVHELHITNFSSRELLISRVELLAGDAALAALEGNDLSASMALPGSGGATDRRMVGAGRRGVVFFWVSIDAKRPAPTSLRHRVSVGSNILDGGEVAVVAAPAITIGPPLRGDGWAAINGPGRDSGHRRALIATNGRARIAQRFGIDFVQRNESGSTYTGDPKDNKSYRCYGTDILAVADATVAATKDGIPENVPGPTSRAVPITSETVGGNFVILDLGGGKFAFYAHIQPGTLRVKTGDRVKRGQVLGLVGNSGNSTEPHLHFHVSDGPDPLGAEGLPYAITGMTGMPLQNARVSFPRISP